ncbi:MAG: phospho-N-acetylmuramoyl-pentapeptide-transferase [Candidatus Omnitrophota bacterium]
MLFRIFYSLKDVWFGFNVFKYITFRAALACFTSFLVSLIFGTLIVGWLKKKGLVQHIRQKHVDAIYDLHKEKQGVPTMGGIIIILSILLSVGLWADITNRYILISAGSIVWLGIVGFIDDYIKISRKRNLGLKTATKFIGQIALGCVIAVCLFRYTDMPKTVCVPFLKNCVLTLGPFYALFVVAVIVGASNAVNLTDGLDGLAIGCTVITALTYAFLSYIAGHIVFSRYLNVFYLPGSGELTILCASIVGAGLGFLWFNCHPANVFMGDTGSLALGGAIGIVALLIKKELLLFMTGGIFVLEALSVMIQVAVYKTTGKRFFLMAPIHHHFQILGWEESKITIRFWVVSIMLAILSLVTLKLQ